MAAEFFDSEGLLLVDIMPHGTTINSDAYMATLKKLQARLSRVRSHRQKQDVLVLHDNVQSPTSLYGIRFRIFRIGEKVNVDNFIGTEWIVGEMMTSCGDTYFKCFFSNDSIAPNATTTETKIDATPSRNCEKEETRHKFRNSRRKQAMERRKEHYNHEVSLPSSNRHNEKTRQIDKAKQEPTSV
ncbi:hypothetical protein ANN_06528 [Periplaneta americana]|uniref:Uncharacterized protein n=1 Tax=Periplaneta americana TaxID=6978 RepID=A0ABQ8TDT3_PERAM|nr:hypothetical protein ANN_06528 [Periplaneta americana]